MRLGEVTPFGTAIPQELHRSDISVVSEPAVTAPKEQEIDQTQAEPNPATTARTFAERKPVIDVHPPRKCTNKFVCLSVRVSVDPYFISQVWVLRLT